MNRFQTLIVSGLPFVWARVYSTLARIVALCLFIVTCCGRPLADGVHHYLRSVYQRARELKVGVGGPDLLPYRPGQMRHSYPLIRACHGSIPTGIAVQEGNYEVKNPRTGKRMPISELLSFANGY